jgi:hypothetical protein
MPIVDAGRTCRSHTPTQGQLLRQGRKGRQEGLSWVGILGGWDSGPDCLCEWEERGRWGRTGESPVPTVLGPGVLGERNPCSYEFVIPTDERG